MKFLVLGSAGMAGHIIALYLKEQGHIVMGYARRENSICDTIIADVKDLDKLKQTIFEGNYDAVINCVGLLNQFAEDNKDDAVFINSFLPHYLAKITADMNTYIIHMSTDCVFSGKTGGYTESSFPDGQTFYDRTKALGELNDNKNVTLRNSIVGPDINVNGIGLLNWFMKQTGEISGYTKAMWTGLTTLELAKVIENVAKNHVTGLYNMVYTESISKYDLLNLFNKYLRNSEIIINKSDAVNLDKSLVRTNFDFAYEVPNYETMVAEMAEWIKNHKEIYSHYDI